jgi:thiol-disulfide isomerase/thioredoxin
MIIKTQRFAFVFVTVLLVLTSCSMYRVKKDKSLKGTQNREVLNDEKAYPWYNTGYEAYTPNKEAVAQLDKAFTAEHKLLVFGGTWCSDTQNLLPKFYKAMDAMQQSPEIQLVMVDMKKESGENIEKGYSIEYVPTFIVLKNDKEIGRVVETVKESIEADLASILAK